MLSDIPHRSPRKCHQRASDKILEDLAGILHKRPKDSCRLGRARYTATIYLLHSSIRQSAEFLALPSHVFNIVWSALGPSFRLSIHSSTARHPTLGAIETCLQQMTKRPRVREKRLLETSPVMVTRTPRSCKALATSSSSMYVPDPLQRVAFLD